MQAALLEYFAYETDALRKGWLVRQLDRQINTQL